MFFTKHLPKMLFWGGLVTMIPGIFVVAPEFAVTDVLKFDYYPDYRLSLMHGGMMVFLMGVFMVYASYVESARPVILLYACIEKAYMVSLATFNLGDPILQGYMVNAVTDFIMVVWTLMFYWEQKAVLNFKSDLLPENVSKLNPSKGKKAAIEY